MRTYWLSFADERGFLGVVVVDVADREASAAFNNLIQGPHAATFNWRTAPWIQAALQNAYAAGVNPGGSVAAYRIDQNPDYCRRCPRLQLLTKADVEALDATLGSLH